MMAAAMHPILGWRSEKFVPRGKQVVPPRACDYRTVGLLASTYVESANAQSIATAATSHNRRHEVISFSALTA